jgi:NADPH:quinone reductase-like Zn-dependent oxidoreductase
MVMGCHVTTSCSTPNVELCKSLGADEVIDYKTQDVVDALKSSPHKFDHVVDNVGNDPSLYYRSDEYTSPKAVFMRVAGSPSVGHAIDVLKMKMWPGFLGGGKRKEEGFFASPEPKDLEQIAAWMKEGKIKALIDSKYSFEEAPKAFEKLKTGRAKGKVVVEVSSEG